MLSGLARLIFSGSIVPSISKAPHLCANENEVSDERLIFGKENGAVPAVGLLSIYCLWQFHSLSLQLQSQFRALALVDISDGVDSQPHSARLAIGCNQQCIALRAVWNPVCVGRDGERPTPTDGSFDVAYEHLRTAVRSHY
jgi:hypothetical protein